MTEARGWAEVKDQPGVDIEASVYVRVDNGSVDEADVQAKLQAYVESILDQSVSVAPVQAPPKAIEAPSPNEAADK